MSEMDPDGPEPDLDEDDSGLEFCPEDDDDNDEDDTTELGVEGDDDE
jgi:hypothetical protein